MAKDAKSTVTKKKKTIEKKVKEQEEEVDLLDQEVDILERKSFKDGQKYPTPPIGDATRGFYESLLEENPKSQIAIKFCLEHGIFNDEKHEKLHILYNKLRENGMLKAPIGGLTLKNI